jgi:hypothetical protein
MMYKAVAFRPGRAYRRGGDIPSPEGTTMDYKAKIAAARPDLVGVLEHETIQHHFGI